MGCPQPPWAPLPVSDHPHGENIFLVSSRELPVLQLVPITSPPSTLPPWEDSGSVSFVPLHEAAADSRKDPFAFSHGGADPGLGSSRAEG